MSSSRLVSGRAGAAIGCQPLPEPEFGAPGVKLVFYLPGQDRGGEILLAPQEAHALGAALQSAATAVEGAYHTFTLRERGLLTDYQPALPALENDLETG